MADILFYAHFVASKVGKTGLTVTLDLRRVDRSTGTASTVATGASATEWWKGWYYYRLTGADINVYDYAAVFITSDSTVDQKEIGVGWTRFSEAVTTDASGRVQVQSGTGAGQISLSSGIVADPAGVTTLLSRLSSARAGYLDALNGHVAQTGDSYARLGAPAGASLSADLAAMRGATFDTSTDSLEALRNRGDAAWITATGFSTLDAAGIRSALGLASADLDTQLDALDAAIGGISGGLDAAGVRAALGLASADLDDQLAALDSAAAAILADTGEIGAAGAGLTALPWNAAWDAEVQSEAADALAAYDPPTKGELDAAVAGLSTLDAAGVRGAVGLAAADLDTQLGGIAARTDALPADPADASAIADDFATVNSTLATITGYLDTEVAAIKAKTDNLPASPAATSDIPSAATIAAAVRDVDNTTPAADSLGAAVNASAAGGLDPQDVADLVVASLGTVDASVVSYATGQDPATLLDARLDAIDSAIAGVSGGGGLDAAGVRAAIGLASANLDTQLAAIDDSLDTEVAAIKAKTDALPASPAASGDIPSAATVATQVRAELATELGRIDAAVSTRLASASYSAPPDAAAIRTAVGLASANLDTQLGAIDDLLDAEIAAIKAKTDLIPASPAATGDIPTASVIAAAVRDVDNTSPVANSLGAGVNLSASGGLDAQDVADLVVAGIGTVEATVAGYATGQDPATLLDARLDALDAALAAAPTAVEVADATLARGVAGVEDAADEHSLTYLILAATEASRDGETLTVRKTDGTAFTTKTLTTDASAEGVTGID